MTHRALPPRRQQGAALLLLLSLIVLGTGAVLIGAFGPGHDDQEKSRVTLRRLADAREALIGYALRNGRLPRPATSALDGRESAQACNSEMDCTGVLPWVTLGVDGVDSWGKLLRYSVTPEFTSASINASTSIASKQVMGRDGDGAPYLKVGSATCSATTLCTPAVVFSSGKNNLGISTLGIAMANAGQSNIDELHNNNQANPFYTHAVRTDPASPGGEFDDLLVWVPLPTLYRQMSTTGTLRTINLYSGMSPR
jgi:hypothetical protein